MHSKIFHITADPEASPVTEFDIPEWFVGSIADYIGTVRNQDEFKSCVDWLADYAQIKIKDNKFKLTPENIDTYFSPMWREFQDAVNNLQAGMTYEGFKGKFSVGIDSLPHLVWQVRTSYEDEFGFYVCDDDGYPVTFSHRLRNYAEPNTTYYIKAVIDYHF